MFQQKLEWKALLAVVQHKLEPAVGFSLLVYPYALECWTMELVAAEWGSFLKCTKSD